MGWSFDISWQEEEGSEEKEGGAIPVQAPGRKLESVFVFIPDFGFVFVLILTFTWEPVGVPVGVPIGGSIERLDPAHESDLATGGRVRGGGGGSGSGGGGGGDGGGG